MTSGYNAPFAPGPESTSPEPTTPQLPRPEPTNAPLPGPRHAAPATPPAFAPGEPLTGRSDSTPLPSRAGPPPWHTGPPAAAPDPSAAADPLTAPGRATAPAQPGAPQPPTVPGWSGAPVTFAAPAPSEFTSAGSDKPGSWAPPADQLRRVAPPRRGWLAGTALLLTLALAGAVGFQGYQIHQLTGRLADADQRLAQAQGADAERFDLVESRTGELERAVGAAFNPEAIAESALPSVFRVAAGRFTGTAFAVGPAGSDGTDLLTNYHVVESSYLAGNRRVFLERDGQRIEAAIVAVDDEIDVAQLRTTESYAGLEAAVEPVRSGQQIVVVGAPLGLADSVTIGVVSAYREADDGSGPVIQFDAPINPGNSGGPVINSSKQVVGIATAKARDAEGIGLAVPIQTACEAFDLC
ncbi:S1C family serine protease [Solwaraspora sp. WMMD791]|uniref:S1C family serine protease n=1 Tax=Solwaraspora sp. WMMD791 TaxID=3016086 RepID=UPI00249B88CC|nr:S1C family serine protease [Solwaraspora sp. WMMD791]WFE27561.1 S1C family serine protease [Solwaraspora sp. WMMD791]